MNYDYITDIYVVEELLNISHSDLARYLNVDRTTISRIFNKQVNPSKFFLESFYSFAYSNQYRRIDLNSLKVQFAMDEFKNVLFHGAKSEIIDEISLSYSKGKNDFGEAFYLGESYTQSSTYIFDINNSSIYLFDVTKLKSLKTLEMGVSFEWMILVCYFRGFLKEYENSELIQNLLYKIKGYDVIIAPIADNNMFGIMEQFVFGYITDLQAEYALAASSLGKQYVLKTKKACNSIKMINRLYLSKEERNEISSKYKEQATIFIDKSKVAIAKHRREGRYIDEIFVK